jgi:GPH family glycoside/pentoside/hexuronide:cation symporter
MTMLAVVVIIAAQPVWIGLSRRMGPKRAYILAVSGWSVVSMSWMLVRPDTVDVIDLPLIGALTAQELGVLGRHVLIAGFNTGMTLLSLSMLTDTVEHDREVTGEAREGAYVGAWSAFEKIALAAGPLWVGPFLQAFDFAAGAGGHGGALVPQSATALWAIRLAAAGIPALICLCTSPLVLRYPLDRRGEGGPRP